MVKDEMVLCFLRSKLHPKCINSCPLMNERYYEVSNYYRFDDTLPYITELITPLYDDRIVSVKRSEAENNPLYVQIVVGLIVKCKNTYLLLKCTNGDMKSHTTLIEGHVNIPKESNDMFMITLPNEVMRELQEEVESTWLFNSSFIKKSINNRGFIFHPKYITYNNSTPENISYYHTGFIYEMVIPDKYYEDFNSDNFWSKEPDKNEIIFVDKEDLQTTLENPDNWLAEMIRKPNF